ncbi:hypothetical protein Trydic_g5072 [Trypoxylus dichotomus]
MPRRNPRTKSTDMGTVSVAHVVIACGERRLVSTPLDESSLNANDYGLFLLEPVVLSFGKRESDESLRKLCMVMSFHILWNRFQVITKTETLPNLI